MKKWKVSLRTNVKKDLLINNFTNMLNPPASYDIIGTPSTPSTLTAAYAANTLTIFADQYKKLQLSFKYTPAAAQVNRFAQILIEYSTDGGTTFVPMTAQITSTDEIEAYDEDFGGNIGLPIIVPGDKTSIGGTLYSGFTQHDIAATHIRISAKENGVANFGTLYLRGTLTSDT